MRLITAETDRTILDTAVHANGAVTLTVPRDLSQQHGIFLAAQALGVPDILVQQRSSHPGDTLERRTYEELI